MSKHWLTIVLFISLAFNLAVMLMFSYMSIYHRPPFCPPGMERPMDRDSHKDRRTKLKPELKQLMKNNREEMRDYREEFAQKRKDFMKTLANDTLRVKDAEAAMEASLKAHEALERKLGSSLINLRSNMSAEEAKIFFRERMNDMNRNHDDQFRSHRKPRKFNLQERR